MSLQFTVEDLINPLVSLSYLSSEKEMEVDDPPSIIAVQSSDTDIEVIACYSEQQPQGPITVTGRGMTTELPSSEDDFSLYAGLYGPSTKVDSVPTDEVVELVLGNYPPLDTPRPIYQQPIAICGQLEPLPDTPQSPPVHERGQNFSHWTDPWEEEQFQYQPENQHIGGGVAVSTKWDLW